MTVEHPTTPERRWVHLVLAGGGSLTLSYAGALTVLHENGIRFRSVCCCSAATFIGALLCARGTPEGLNDVVRKLRLPRIAGQRALPIPDLLYALVPGLLAANPLLRWPFARFHRPGFAPVFQDLVGGDPAFRDLQIRFATAGFDLVQRRFLVYASDSHPEMKVSEALSIAVSIPFAYPPHERDGRIVLDAAVASECPVWMAADQDPALPIVALRPFFKSRPGERPKSAGDYLSAVTISATRGLDDYIMSQMPRVKLMEIDCAGIQGSRFDLTGREKEALIDAGARAAQAGLQRFGADLKKSGVPPSGARIGDANDATALQHGTTLMTRFHQDLSKEVSNRVFISYAHEDVAWVESIKQAVGEMLPISATWDDTRINPGEHWRTEIETALNGSRVALLLLSPHFFASQFITEDEVPAIVAAGLSGRLIPIPLFVSADDIGWQSSPLNQFQAFNIEHPLERQPADATAALFERLADEIKRHLQIGS
jgi:Predicted esterase of the alpha-beta hydrolase superfamily